MPFATPAVVSPSSLPRASAISPTETPGRSRDGVRCGSPDPPARPIRRCILRALALAPEAAPVATATRSPRERSARHRVAEPRPRRVGAARPPRRPLGPREHAGSARPLGPALPATDAGRGHRGTRTDGHWARLDRRALRLVGSGFDGRSAGHPDARVPGHARRGRGRRVRRPPRRLHGPLHARPRPRPHLPPLVPPPGRRCLHLRRPDPHQ